MVLLVGGTFLIVRHVLEKRKAKEEADIQADPAKKKVYDLKIAIEAQQEHPPNEVYK